MIFEIEITRFRPEPVTSRTTASSAGGADAAVRTAADADACVLVAWSKGEVSLGEMHIWLANDRALVRLDEHRDWHASGPATLASAPAGDVWFRDSDGAQFPAQAAETVSRALAFEALGHWLCTGEMVPNLVWN